MKYLITGGAGFIGSHLAEYLTDHHQDVAILDDFSGGFLDNIPKSSDGLFRCRVYTGSITDRNFTDMVVREERPDIVIHAADG